MNCIDVVFTKPENKKGSCPNISVEFYAPPTDKGFSGANGYTMGVVYLFGNTFVSPFGETDPKTISSQVDDLIKAWNIITTFLLGK